MGIGSFILILIIAQFPILNFLSDIVIYILMFSVFSVMSFSSILNFKEESIKILKLISIGALIFIGMLSLGILLNTHETIEYIRVISNDRVNLSLTELYIANFTALILAAITTSFFIYIMYWCMMGFIPTFLLIFVFLIVKSAYLLDSFTKVKGVGTILILLNIIGLIINGMYN